jgi:hypothetical protein
LAQQFDVVKQFALAAVLWPVIVSAQMPSKAQTPAEILRSSQQGFGEVQQLRAALRSPDPAVRVSTFSAMVESNNAAMTAMAINEAHAGTDPTLRDMAARAAFKELSTVAMELVAPPSPDARERYLKSAAAGGPTLRIDKYDWHTGMAEIWNGKSQISGATFTFNSIFCRGSLSAVEGTWDYEGVVSCVNGPNSQFMDKVRFRIR